MRSPPKVQGSERDQVNLSVFTLPLDQLTVPKNGNLILQFPGRELNCVPEFLKGDFALGLDEFVDRFLLFGQTLRPLKPSQFSKSFGRVHCSRVTSLNAVTYLFLFWVRLAFHALRCSRCCNWTQPLNEKN
jgi:hypothetical protein